MSRTALKRFSSPSATTNSRTGFGSPNHTPPPAGETPAGNSFGLSIGALREPSRSRNVWITVRSAPEASFTNAIIAGHLDRVGQCHKFGW